MRETCFGEHGGRVSGRRLRLMALAVSLSALSLACGEESQKLLVVDLNDQSGAARVTRVEVRIAGGRTVTADGPVPAGIGIYVPSDAGDMLVEVVFWDGDCLVGYAQSAIGAPATELTRVPITVGPGNGACGVDGGAGGTGAGVDGGVAGGGGGAAGAGGSAQTGGHDAQGGGSAGTAGDGSAGAGGQAGGSGGQAGGAGGQTGGSGGQTGGSGGQTGGGTAGDGGSGGSQGSGGVGGSGGAGSSVSCGSDAECPSTDYFCDRGCSASAKGSCVLVPRVCTMVYAPVCGCNGTTYGNDCTRQANRVGKAHDGACVSTDPCAGVICAPGYVCCRLDGRCYRQLCVNCCEAAGTGGAGGAVAL